MSQAALRYLLLQVRNSGDPMASHEIACFARALRCPVEQVMARDLIAGVPSHAEIDTADVVLLGGSGDYSVVEGGPWFEVAMETMRELHEWSKPTFASCWGFQAMARAMGGRVVNDLGRAELGTNMVSLTEDGSDDPIFGPLGHEFPAQMGHQDIVETIPSDAILLASTDRCRCQAFRFRDKPIYCTQFHPELDRSALLDRLRQYPQYAEIIARIPYEELVMTCFESPGTDLLLDRFSHMVARMLK